MLFKLKLFQYSFIALPLAFAGLPIYVHAPDFYAVNYQISLSVIGFTLLFLRIIDAVQDPIIGYYSDKYHSKRTSIIMAALIILGVGFWMIFHPTVNYTLAWLVISTFICTTGFSILSINVQTIGSLWDTQEKNYATIMGTREGVGLIGLLIASALPSIFLLTYSAEQSFHYLSLILIGLILIGGFLYYKWAKSTKTRTPSQNQQKRTFFTLLKSRNIAPFYGIYLISAIASAIPATLIIFFIRDYLGAENYTGLFLVLYFLSGALAMPFWQFIARKTSNIHAWLYGLILACVSFAGAIFLEGGDIIGFSLICIMTGIAVGADLSLPPAIIALIIKAQKHEETASQYYAILTFIAKAALAIAVGLSFPLLEFSGYTPDSLNSNTAILIYAYAFVPLIIKVISAILLFFYIKKESSFYKRAS